MNEQDEQAAKEHHIVGPGTYAIILFALLVGTALTVLASYFDLGEWHIAKGLTLFWNPVVALAIATAKMTLVVLFFMHIKYSSRLTKLTIGSGIFVFLGLIAMTLSDYVSRAWGQW
jgi:cytochrome c oxidase subunit IV